MQKVKLQKLSKTIFTLAVVCMLLLGQASSVCAAEYNNDYNAVENVQNVAEELNITVHEAENLEQNLDKAVAQLPDLEVGESATVPVSENLVLEAEAFDDGQTLNPLNVFTVPGTINSIRTLIL